VFSAFQMSKLSESHWYLKAPSAHEGFQVLRAVFLAPISLVTAPSGSTYPGLDAWLPRRFAQLVVTVVPTVPLLAALPGALERGARGLGVRIALAGLFLPLVVVLAVSFRVPLWLPRYFVFLTPFLAILVARGVTALRPPALGRLWGAAVLVVSAYGCLRYDLDYTKEPWRDVVRTIAATGPPGRTAALVAFDVDPFRFYDVKLQRPVAAFEVSHPDVPFASSYTTAQLDWMERRAAEHARPYEQVWVVVRSPNSAARHEVVARAQRAAAAGRERRGEWKWDSVAGPLWATRYVKAAAAEAGPGR